jgi:hypothetical protein
LGRRDYIISGLALLTFLFILPGLANDPPAAAAQTSDKPKAEITVSAVTEPTAKVVPADDESAKIEQALVDSGYLSDSIPLSYDDQTLLRAACEEFSLPYSIALGVIENETNFQNVVGDDGNSYGYMQIQPRWWSAKIKALGETDLMNPKSNFRVGCSILADLIRQYGTEGGLTAYNSGSPGHSEYATAVMANADRWSKILK